MGLRKLVFDIPSREQMLGVRCPHCNAGIDQDCIRSSKDISKMSHNRRELGIPMHRARFNAAKTIIRNERIASQ